MNFNAYIYGAANNRRPISFDYAEFVKLISTVYEVTNIAIPRIRYGQATRIANITTNPIR